ncbi:MAG: hypothetical protein SVT52_03865, partial [Planctomycetota bacterium]|nr:hypothetical protein [Planctomycetota bacterium]
QAGSVGLEKGNFVQVGDDQVGKIAGIRFDPASGRTYYTAKIERDDFKVHRDGKARVVAALIGGARLVIVDRGSGTEPLADDENPIELKGGMDQTMSDLASATEKVNKIADVIQKELNADDSKAMLNKVHAVIDSLKLAATDVAETAASIREMTAKVRPDVEKTVAAVTETAEQIRSYTKKDIAEMLAKLRKTNTHILKIAGDFATVSEQTKQLVLVHRQNIDELIDNMTQVSADLKATAKEVRRNPWRLLHRPDEKELHSQNIYDAATAFYSGAEQLDQAITKLNALAKAHPEGIPSDDPQLQKIRQQVEKTFSRFSKAEQSLWKEMQK